MIDTLLARQHAQLATSIAELREALDDDDNWRALAALDSVREASGDAGGTESWACRRHELLSALDENPLYRLHCELERARAVAAKALVVAESVGVPEPVPAPASDPVDVAPVEISDDYAADACNFEIAHPAAPLSIGSGVEVSSPQADAIAAPISETPVPIVVYEPRRESIAARIATLAMPPFLLPDASDEGLRTEAVQAQSPPAAVDVVEAVAMRIVASFAKGAPAQPVAGSVQQPELMVTADRVDRRDSVDVIRPDGPTPDMAVEAPCDAPLPTAGEDMDFAASEDDDVHGDVEANSYSPGLADDGGDDLFDGSDSEDFEADVAIVPRHSSAPGKVSINESPGTSVPPPASNVALSPALSALEKRLQRLDRKSADLLQAAAPEKPSHATELDEEARANSWLEMIRARRAKPIYEQDHQPIPDLRLDTEHIGDVMKNVKDVQMPPEMSDDAGSFGDGLLAGAFEAEVKIVQRKSRLSAGRELQTGTRETVQRMARPVPVPREPAVEPAIPHAGGVEEASVEIVRRPRMPGVDE